MGNARVAWFMFAVVLSAMVGGVAGVLSSSAGLPPPSSIIAGAGAFGGVMALTLTALQFLAGGKD